MAEEAPQPDAEQDSEEPTKKGKGKLIIIIVSTVVLLAIIGGVLAFVLGGGDEAPAKICSD
ncbi:flagellar basal body-associated FliL family protein [Piscirickettsia litoralis]|uniref:Flagellar basal body protein FliL n=1 Tax=Piscirickettsia litoralis TaxID=1891921 RepID=A0ABX3A0W3_9GAMM|nr:hypothetical protein [Piscirickettsia litoralis]ODN42093.1 hypothetical protein BGC07_02935 [Piscirickettsia litoralis]